MSLAAPTSPVTAAAGHDHSRTDTYPTQHPSPQHSIRPSASGTTAAAQQQQQPQRQQQDLQPQQRLQRGPDRGAPLRIVSHNGGPPLGPGSLSRRLLAMGAVVAPHPLPPPPTERFRFWLDEVLWSQGRVAVELADQVFSEAGGLRTGGPSHEPRADGGARSAGAGPGSERDRVLGAERLDAWELLWTKSTFAIPAARQLRPGQQVSALIGLNSLTMKKRMALTLQAAYGPAHGGDGGGAASAQHLSRQARAHAARQQQQPQGQRPSSPGDGAASESRGGGDAQGAWALTPLTFALPEGLEAWRRWLEALPADVRRGELWMLKTGQDAGKGLVLKAADDALEYATQQLQQQAPGKTQGQAQGQGQVGPEAVGRGGSGRQRRHFPLQVAQRYVPDPLLIQGRKSHLRLWVVVTQHSPLTAYLHRCGLVLFSSETYDPSLGQPAAAACTSPTDAATQQRQQRQPATAAPAAASHVPDAAASATVPKTAPSVASTPSKGAVAGSSAGAGSSSASRRSSAATAAAASSGGPALWHVTNYARNANGLVWDLTALEQHLGPQQYAALWARIGSTLARALAASRGALQEATAWLQPAIPCYGFQMMGVDLLLDRALRPWILEFNSAPSIMVQHEDPATLELIRQQKAAMLADMLALVRHRLYAPVAPGAAGQQQHSADGAKREAAAAAATRFQPLMDLFP